MSGRRRYNVGANRPNCTKVDRPAPASGMAKLIAARPAGREITKVTKDLRAELVKALSDLAEAKTEIADLRRRLGAK